MGKTKPDPSPRGGIFDGPGFFTRLRMNIPQLSAGVKGRVKGAEARRSGRGLAVAQFRFDTLPVKKLPGPRRGPVWKTYAFLRGHR